MSLFHELYVYFHAHTGPIRSNIFHAQINWVVSRDICLFSWSYRFSVDFSQLRWASIMLQAKVCVFPRSPPKYQNSWMSSHDSCGGKTFQIFLLGSLISRVHVDMLSDITTPYHHIIGTSFHMVGITFHRRLVLYASDLAITHSTWSGLHSIEGLFCMQATLPSRIVLLLFHSCLRLKKYSNQAMLFAECYEHFNALPMCLWQVWRFAIHRQL